MGLLIKRRSEEQKKTFKSEESEEEQRIKDIEWFARRCKDEIEIGILTVLMLSTFLSLIFYVVDIAFDIYWLISFYVQGDYWYLRCSLAFLVIPAIISTVRNVFIYSNEWMNRNEKDPRDFLPKEEDSNFNFWPIKWILAFICPIPRYWNVIKYAYKANQTKANKDDDNKKMYFLAMIWEDAELIQLRQFDCFIESAPQLLLNLYIMFKGESHFGDLSTICPIFSIISLSWALVTYDQKIGLIKAIKRDDENRQNQSNDISVDDMTNIVINYIGNINFKNIALLFFANFFFIVSRLIAFGLFATGYGWLIWLTCLGHLTTLTILWHWSENNYHFMDSLRLSFLHIFAYLYPLENESDRQKYPRLPPLFYLYVSFFENLCLMTLWSQSLIEGDDRLSFTKSCALLPWREWNFFIPWILQLSTIISSSLLFWSYQKERQSEIS